MIHVPMQKNIAQFKKEVKKMDAVQSVISKAKRKKHFEILNRK